ncbi:phage tail protein [Roseixanthobacter glucoisosaccharinicivorans]|uniref:phage tail protein n=1 Tax=Roseixanthobacter glucoisosaccharinicivorans TaxID=3119923 RepID=UPI00372C2D80
MDGYIGEVRIFSTDYPPRGWMPCTGQILQVGQYQALFSVLGNTYGGDGRTTFGIPDLRGRAAVCTGASTGATLTFQRGTTAGLPAVALNEAQMPAHTHLTHRVNVSGSITNKTAGPSSTSYPAAVTLPTPTGSANWPALQTPANPNTTLNFSTILPAGGGAAHQNVQPVLSFIFCICIDGEYPVPD